MEPAQLTLSPDDSADVRRLAQRLGKTETELLHEAVAALMRQTPTNAPIGNTPAEAEREEWFRFSTQNLARAYGDDEPEYTLADVKIPNPRYDGG